MVVNVLLEVVVVVYKYKNLRMVVITYLHLITRTKSKY